MISSRSLKIAPPRSVLVGGHVGNRGKAGTAHSLVVRRQQHSPLMNVAVPRLVSLFLLAVLVGCSSVRPWINEPRRPGPRPDVRAIAQRDSSALFAVSLSGGGARAAAFGYGVPQELRETPCCWNDRGGNILDAVDVISGVSGGSIVAAYFAAFGAEGLPSFEPDFLRQDVQEGLLSQLFRPGNLLDLTSPYFGRTNLLERRLETLYRGLTFGDLERRPRHTS